MGDLTGSEGQQSNPILGFLPIILMFVVLYLLMIRPQMKKQKNQQRLIDELEKGDEIVTNGGIHGSIQNIKDDILVIKIADNVKIELSRAAVQRVKGKEDK
jgi:preprotein translocase subunit YajC